MALDATVENAIRLYVGTAYSADDLEVRYTRLGSANDVALEILKLRRADLLATASSFSVPGEYSESWADAQLQRLDALIFELIGLGAGVDDDGQVAGAALSHELVRPGWSRGGRTTGDQALDVEAFGS